MFLRLAALWHWFLVQALPIPSRPALRDLIWRRLDCLDPHLPCSISGAQESESERGGDGESKRERAREMNKRDRQPVPHVGWGQLPLFYLSQVDVVRIGWTRCVEELHYLMCCMAEVHSCVPTMFCGKCWVGIGHWCSLKFLPPAAYINVLALRIKWTSCSHLYLVDGCVALKCIPLGLRHTFGGVRCCHSENRLQVNRCAHLLQILDSSGACLP